MVVCQGLSDRHRDRNLRAIGKLGVESLRPQTTALEHRNSECKEGSGRKPQSVNLQNKGSRFTALHLRSLVISSPLRQPSSDKASLHFTAKENSHLSFGERCCSERAAEVCSRRVGPWVRMQSTEVHPDLPPNKNLQRGTPPICMLTGSQEAHSLH